MTERNAQPVTVYEDQDYFSATLKDSMDDPNVAGNFASTTEFIYEADSDGQRIQKMFVSIQADSGSYTAITYGTAPRLDSATEDGVRIFTDKGGDVTIYNEDVPIRDNGDWSIFGDQHQILTYGLTATDHMKVGIMFPTPIILNTGDVFGITVKGDLSNLARQYFQIHGSR